jgi:hypothetical protein
MQNIDPLNFSVSFHAISTRKINLANKRKHIKFSIIIATPNPTGCARNVTLFNKN